MIATRPGKLTGRRLLVVEDEALVALMIEDMLADLGCQVVGPAGNVPQARALIEREPIDAAVLDVNLGGAERSYPIADELLARQIPFVFVTGYGEAGIDPAYQQIAVLQKPFVLYSLEKLLADNLERR